MVRDLAEALVDALQDGTGTPTRCRLNHARGLLLKGRFRPSAAGRTICSAETFKGADLPVTARLSSSSGDPHIPQDHPGANPRGLAIRIGGGASLVLVGHSVHAFPARDAAGFLKFLQVLQIGGTHPQRLDRYMREHEAARHFEAVKATLPSSFVKQRYHMLHAYRLTGPDRSQIVGRLSIVGQPDGTTKPMDAGRHSDYLDRDLRQRLSRGPIDMDLEFQQVPAGVDETDVSAPWPDGETVHLGRFFLDRVAADQAAQQRMVFDPGELPAGVAFAGDAMIAARVAAYRLAFHRRTAESDGTSHA